MKFKKIVGFGLYMGIAKHLPPSQFFVNIGQKQFRAFCGKLILAKCGRNVNIEKGAVFSGKVELGDRSGIGVDAYINGKCVIGNNVMMGPQCIIYTRNHKFEDVSVPHVPTRLSGRKVGPYW